ncbi:hypothetical protein DFH29DRAFT_1001718 [Suillus ampliporus]|nr:hypothetical protein DFH29DRAFT_1001718 [Suillus ampliporus]
MSPLRLPHPDPMTMNNHPTISLVSPPLTLLEPLTSPSRRPLDISPSSSNELTYPQYQHAGVYNLSPPPPSTASSHQECPMAMPASTWRYPTPYPQSHPARAAPPTPIILI